MAKLCLKRHKTTPWVCFCLFLFFSFEEFSHSFHPNQPVNFHHNERLPHHQFILCLIIIQPVYTFIKLHDYIIYRGIQVVINTGCPQVGPIKNRYKLQPLRVMIVLLLCTVLSQVWAAKAPRITINITLVHQALSIFETISNPLEYAASLWQEIMSPIRRTWRHISQFNV